MPTDHRSDLAKIKRFDQLIAYLRDEMGWPIARDSFEDVNDLFYDFTADELGIDPKTAAKIESIKRLRPLSAGQPWGIFFVKFEPKRLPVVALRRILSRVALKKRASSNRSERAAWAAGDLLFVSNYGNGDERQICFAHFSQAEARHDLPTLKVLGWDNLDTALHLDAVAKDLIEHLAWPDDEADLEAWRKHWRAAFTLRHYEVVTTSKELSVRLAELARAIRDRIRAALAIETEAGPLTKLMKAFKEALVHDLDTDSFADMYAQTIAYGLLSARIADPHKKTADDFAAHMRTNPFLRELMETFLQVGGRRGKAAGPGIDFDELGVSEVVELLDGANMEAVVRDFGDRNPQEDPVIHFYELFLKEYDARKRMQRGVFYTPRSVVSFIVRSVDQLLRTEFGLADGLADTTNWGEMTKLHQGLKCPEGISPEDDFVQILDPATGTGTFLVEVIELIHKTLVSKWKAQGHSDKRIEALWNEYVPKHLLTRLHGYELLMAPYAIAHLKIGLKLYETGYRFGMQERARVYLTNALEPAHDLSATLQFAIPALAHEAQAVNDIKRRQRFTVILGNPPYSKLSSNRQTAAEALVAPFKSAVRHERNIQPLSDDYLKFLGLALAASQALPLFVVGVITNRGYLGGLIHRGVRHVLITNFQKLWFVDLHGDSNVGERSPNGSANENVFDIQQGVAVALGVKIPSTLTQISRCEVWGTRDEKQSKLVKLNVSGSDWDQCAPKEPNYFFQAPAANAVRNSEALLPLNIAMPVTSTGIKTHRDSLVIDFEAETLLERVRYFINMQNSDSEVRSRFFGTEHEGRYKPGDNRDWSLSEARRALQSGRSKLEKYIREIDYRPLDSRFIFYNSAAIDFAREDLMRHMEDGRNIGLITTRQVPNGDFCHAFVTRRLVEMKTCSHDRGTNLFPLRLKPYEDSLKRLETWEVNFSEQFLKAISSALNVRSAEVRGVPEGLTPEDILGYIYALLYSPGYRSRYAELLKVDFPPLPLSKSIHLFRELARLGSELVALHLMESPAMDLPITTYVGPKNPAVGRVGWSNDTVWLDSGATRKDNRGMSGTVGFHGVPEVVWNFHIGGYQISEKWLKDRKGRSLSKDDIAHYQKIIVALAETIRLMQEIDQVIDQYGGWPGAFQMSEDKSTQNAVDATVNRFQPRIIEPRPEERYKNCLPLVPLKAAAGVFSDPQHIEDNQYEWTIVDTRHRLHSGMFVAQVVGQSMEPAIPDGSYCIFVAPVTGTRQGKTVLVQLRGTTDPETGERYTVKRYESEKGGQGDLWRHATISLKPLNPKFETIELTDAEEGQVQVVAEFIEVLEG